MLSLSGNIAAWPRRARVYQSLSARLRQREARGRRGRLSLDGARSERADAGAMLRDVLVGVVGGAHERSRGDVLEAEVVGGALERGELVGMPVAHHREVALGGAQVLADGQHLHVARAQRGEG